MWQLSFLNTGLLIFAAATVIPLLIWLLAKKKPPRIIFSTIRFIKQTEKEQKTRSQLKNILLLIIRMLIILLVILAASRPSLLNKRPQAAQKGKKHPPTAIAILLDTSYSMDYTPGSKSYLESAKAAVLEINKRATEQDLVVMVSSDESWNRIHSQLNAGKFPTNLIATIKTTWQPLPLAKMYEVAVQKLKDSQYSNSEIYVLTDGQAQALPAKPSLPVIFIPVSEAKLSYAKTSAQKAAPVQEGLPNNLSAQNARPIKQLTDKQQTQTISFDLVNHGSSLRNDVLVRVDFNGVKAAEKFVTLQPGQRLAESLPVQITTSGWQTGYVEVLDEKLTADNRAYFAFEYDLSPNIGVITQCSSLPLILNSVLSVFATKKGSIKLIPPAQVNTEQLRDYSFLVVYDAGELTGRLRTFLNDWNSAGHRMFFIANRDLGVGWKAFYTQRFGTNLRDYVTVNKPLSFINPYHRITSMLDSKQRKTSVTEFWQATAAGKAEILLSSDNSPLAVATDTDLLWLFDPMAMNNRFFLDASYPVFAFRCFEYLTDVRFDNENLSVGQTVSADKVLMPGNQENVLNGNPLKLAEPGIYTVYRRGEEAQTLAVQPDYAESNFATLAIPQRKNYHILSGNWQQQLFLNRLGIDLWKYCLLAVLFLLLCELFIVKSEEWKKDK